MSLLIRPVESIAEYHACEEIQQIAWVMPHGIEIVPLHLLIAVQKQGGLLLGAFDGGNLVGFVFGFLGKTREGHLKHCSHMMGVLPQYRSQGIGYQLKVAQREAVLSQGLDLVTWTFDPLESRNAHLNIHKLGAVSRTYMRDLYGPMADGLNAGLPSDRLQVEWWIQSARVQRRLAGHVSQVTPGALLQANPVTSGPTGHPAPVAPILDASAPCIAVEVPVRYQAIKAADPELASQWRLVVRQVFETYFAAGYYATDYLSWHEHGERRACYLLARNQGA
jgi:predicted GNAT superfamily acetyltransferase